MSGDGDRPGHRVGEVVGVLRRLADDRPRVSFGDLLDALGYQSFAAVLLMLGLIMLAPGPADIPGVPVVMGLIIALLCGELIWGSDHVWVPGFVEGWSVKSSRLDRVAGWLATPAGWLDRWTRRRWTVLTSTLAIKILAGVCLAVMATTPILEFIPFSASLAGAVATALGIVLLTHDGLVAAIMLVAAASLIVLLPVMMP